MWPLKIVFPALTSTEEVMAERMANYGTVPEAGQRSQQREECLSYANL